jgi:hypothetical protein
MKNGCVLDSDSARYEDVSELWPADKFDRVAAGSVAAAAT